MIEAELAMIRTKFQNSLRSLATLLLAGTAWGAEPPGLAELQLYEGTPEYPLASRNALVIGVQSLQTVSGFRNLKNPANDAVAVTKALRKLRFNGFNLNEMTDGSAINRQAIKRALYDFGNILRSQGGLGLVYLSGHGLQRDGVLYFAPHDAYVQYNRDFAEELIPINLIYDAFAYANNPFNLLVLDTCRDDPWDGPIVEFGKAPRLSAPDSERVVRLTATLAGRTAADGDGSLSPFAAAFIKAVTAFDLTLPDVSSVISSDVRSNRAARSINEVPILGFFGRDFVFAPTKASYRQEEAIFQAAKAAGNRDAFEQLKWKYPGGYFYRAADECLQTCDLAPASATLDRRSVETLVAGPLKEKPGSTSAATDVLPAGSTLQVVGKPSIVEGVEWLPVKASFWQTAAFIRVDNVRLTAPPSELVTRSFDFVDGSSVSPARLSQAAARRVGDIAKTISKTKLPALEIVGIKSPKDAAVPVSAQQLLARQAEVLQALKDAGMDVSKAFLRTETSTDPALDGKVNLRIVP